MSMLIRIADLVLNRPLLVTPDKAQVIMSVLAGRIGVGAPGASRFEGESAVVDQDGRARGVPFKVKDGVGIITITGSLVNRGAWVGASSGLTSYEGIGHQLKSAASDPAVRSVILDLHSPGGEATGAFEAAALVRSLASKKRTVALVNGMACSAAYAIASGATEIVTTETGVSGSIGVVLLHADYSKRLAKEGIDPTLIFAGAHKVDGNPFEPLSADVRDDLQREVTAFYDLFLTTVAKGRGSRLTAKAARATEARTFVGRAAVAAGMADRVGTFESVLAELSRSSSTTKPQSPGSQAFESARVEAARMVADRFTSALMANGVAGNGARMAAALDLLISSPEMAGADVAAAVTIDAQRTRLEKPAKSGLSRLIDARISREANY